MNLPVWAPWPWKPIAFRCPEKGEWFLNDDVPEQCLINDFGSRQIILEHQKDGSLVAMEVQGQVSDGERKDRRVLSGFICELGEEWYSFQPDSCRGWVEPEVPEGYIAVDIRPPETGETYVLWKDQEPTTRQIEDPDWNALILEKPPQEIGLEDLQTEVQFSDDGRLWEQGVLTSIGKSVQADLLYYSGPAYFKFCRRIQS